MIQQPSDVDFECGTNEAGYPQYFSVGTGEPVCPVCGEHYLNVGAGTMCPNCPDYDDHAD